MKFCKYHGLGNDYIVLDADELAHELSQDLIRLICHRNYGVGADGILLGQAAKDAQGFALRIFNPDGSEAEKSGNGLRIFSRYLWDTGRINEGPFDVRTKGGVVRCRVRDGGKSITVEMGRVSFRSQDVPVTGQPREILDEEIVVLAKALRHCAATIGNPHCVILCDQVSKDETLKYGPVIEIDERFPNRTNVQFMQVIDRNNIRIEIWERGAGYTLASGSSSSAAAAVAFRLGLCDSNVTVHMPGGQLQITIGADYAISMTGPVTKVAEGTISKEMFANTPSPHHLSRKT